MKSIIAVILAAGKGTRLNSDKPKVLHTINNKPMIHHVIKSCNAAKINDICLVVGYKKDDVIKSCKPFNVNHCLQEEQLGTGHAVICALPEIKQSNCNYVVILAGDCPLIQSKTTILP